MAELKTLLFDLDGTLVRTREASWELFRQTNEKFGLGVDTPSAFFRLFNENFYTALDARSPNGKQGEAESVRRHFQTLLRDSYHPELVPGMASVVHSLAAHYTLVVMSSNTMEAVRRILLQAGVANCFAHVFSGDVTPNKQEAIRRFLEDPSYSCGRRCSPHYEESTPERLHLAGEAMLITDTVGDVTEARAAGIRVGAVAWGMHRAEDLEESGAEFVCIWPEELVAYLQPGEACSTGTCHLPSVAIANGNGTAVPTAPAPVLTGSTPPASTLPGAVRRARREAAATALATQLGAVESSGGGDCGCGCTGSTPSDEGELRRVLEALLVPPGQGGRTGLSPRPKAPVPFISSQLTTVEAQTMSSPTLQDKEEK